MRDSHHGETFRLTMAQALVKYLQVQYSEHDGTRRRLIPAMFGIFGHGNVHALGQALYEYGADLPYHRPCNEQAMVHTAAGFARANLRLATIACTSSIGPGATNMVTGAAAATINRLPVLLLPSDTERRRRQQAEVMREALTPSKRCFHEPSGSPEHGLGARSRLVIAVCAETDEDDPLQPSLYSGLRAVSVSRKR